MALVLTDEMKEAINSALSQRVPIIVAANDADGQPYMSLRGSTHVHSDDQLGIWLRNVDGTTANGIQKNNKVSLFYRNPETRLSFQMQGRAQLVTDKALEDKIWNDTPEPERNADAERKGGAMLVDLDRVIQRNQVVLSRD
jgi:general stress protein 26